MNRTRLIWFACGAAVSALATLVTQVVVKEPEAAVPFLSITEKAASSVTVAGVTEQTLSSGALLRECGAQTFLIKQDKAPGSVPYALMAISTDTAPAIQCILARAAKEDIPVNIQMITDRHAQTH